MDSNNNNSSSTLQKVLDAFRGIKGPSSNGVYTAHCPSHDDKRSSLCISIAPDGKVLLHCQAGCKTSQVVEAAGLRMRDLFPPKPKEDANKSAIPTIVKPDAEILSEIPRSEPQPEPLPQAVSRPKGRKDSYVYVDENGNPRYKVVRTADKQFPQYHYDETSRKWVKGMDGIERIPYNLPNVIKAVSRDNYIFIVEGEKDANTLHAHRFPATCNSGGAGKWMPSFAQYFKGASIIIIPDNDKPGCDHANDVAISLAPTAKEIRILQLPVPHKGDVSDWFLTGGDEESFIELALQSPIWHVGDEIEPWGEAKGQLGTATPIKSTVYSPVYNAERFHEQHGQNVKYCSDYKCWYYWDSQIWREDKNGVVQRMMLDMVKSQYAELAEMSRNEASNLLKHIKESERPTGINNALDMLKLLDNITINADAFDVNPYLLSTLNGTINLQTGTLQPFKRENMITVQINVPYDPEAQCPRWELFISQIFPDDIKTQQYMQRMTGYFLLGNNKKQECYFFFGKSSTGKSVFAETISKILGKHASPILQSQLIKNVHGNTNDKYGVADIWMKHVVTCSEFSNADNLDENIIKSLTGGDSIQVCKKFGHPFTVQPRFKLLLYTNFIPKFKSTGYDMRKRLRIIPFTQTFYSKDEGKLPVRDDDLKEKLLNEQSGILTWAVKGCLDCLENGNPESPAIRNCTDTCFEDQDIICEFLESTVVFDFQQEINLKDLWEEITRYYTDQKRSVPFRDSRGLKANLQNRDGISFRRVNGIVKIRGLAWKDGRLEFDPNLTSSGSSGRWDLSDNYTPEQQNENYSDSSLLSLPRLPNGEIDAVEI